MEQSEPRKSTGLAELGMIEEGMNYEYSGKLLAVKNMGTGTSIGTIREMSE